MPNKMEAFDDEILLKEVRKCSEIEVGLWGLWIEYKV